METVTAFLLILKLVTGPTEDNPRPPDIAITIPMDTAAACAREMLEFYAAEGGLDRELNRELNVIGLEVSCVKPIKKPLPEDAKLKRKRKRK